MIVDYDNSDVHVYILVVMFAETHKIDEISIFYELSELVKYMNNSEYHMIGIEDIENSSEYNENNDTIVMYIENC